MLWSRLASCLPLSHTTTTTTKTTTTRRDCSHLVVSTTGLSPPTISRDNLLFRLSLNTTSRGVAGRSNSIPARAIAPSLCHSFAYTGRVLGHRGRNIRSRGRIGGKAHPRPSWPRSRILAAARVLHTARSWKLSAAKHRLGRSRECV
ncbi:hypothetical protein M433DRAFT_381767 [Acidomyces richmondensis BFW]|nr:MAG: hypothetical protein FE78DRAFT_247340 [Acidomyces sp. 'richmondensis']KYG42902.1 hypothetical protein M433DRAFT_381767 [Acidomyces richmondensis BFW]